jgi:hypothetical protein
VTFDSTYPNDDTGALQQVVDGKADAWIVGTGKVMPIVRNLKNENRRLHLVSIPYDKRLRDLYVPSDFSGGRIPESACCRRDGRNCCSKRSACGINFAEKTEQYQRVAKFVEALFSRIDEFSKPPRHPKWKEGALLRSYLSGSGLALRTGSTVGMNKKRRGSKEAACQIQVTHEGALRSVPGRVREIICGVPRVGTTRQGLVPGIIDARNVV